MGWGIYKGILLCKCEGRGTWKNANKIMENFKAVKISKGLATPINLAAMK